MPPENDMIVSKGVTLYPEILRTASEFTVYFSKMIAKGSDFGMHPFEVIGPIFRAFEEGYHPEFSRTFCLFGGIFCYCLKRFCET